MKVLAICLLIIAVCFLIFYPMQKLTEIGTTESKETYTEERTYNSTETYYVNETYTETECQSYYNNKNDVSIMGSTNTYDFFYEVNYVGDYCTLNNHPSTDKTNIDIMNSADTDLTYPITIEYYAVPNCNENTITYYDPRPTANYGNFTVRHGKSYSGYLYYEKVYNMRPNTTEEALTAFSFVVGVPVGCKQVRKTREVEKTRPINITKNETLYRPVFTEDNLSVKISLFQRWTKGNNPTTYGCPSSYYFTPNQTCFRKIE